MPTGSKWVRELSNNMVTRISKSNMAMTMKGMHKIKKTYSTEDTISEMLLLLRQSTEYWAFSHCSLEWSTFFELHSTKKQSIIFHINFGIDPEQKKYWSRAFHENVHESFRNHLPCHENVFHGNPCVSCWKNIFLKLAFYFFYICIPFLFSIGGNLLHVRHLLL